MRWNSGIRLLRVLALGIFLNTVAQAQVSSHTKREWLQELRRCQPHCRETSLKISQEITNHYKEAFIHIRPEAKATVYFIHSFTLSPTNPKDNYEYLKRLKLNPEINVVAPVLAAHHSDSSPQEYFDVQPEDWILDAELGLFLAHGLGKKVIFQGFSLGAILGTYLAQRYPFLIDRLLITSPPFMIIARGDDLACYGREPLIQIITKTFSSFPKEYIEKYLNGACPLALTIKKVRDLQRIPQLFGSKFEDLSRKTQVYQRRLRQVELWGKAITQKTLLIYSEADGIIDQESLKRFSKNLRSSQIVVYKKKRKIGHVATFKNQPVVGTSRDIYQVMDSFILE